MTQISAASFSAPPAGLETARAQAQELEGIFLNTLVSQMFSSLGENKQTGGGFGEETWRSMQSEMLANKMAEAGGIGLADQLMSDLIAVQEAMQNQPPMPAGNPYPGV